MNQLTEQQELLELESVIEKGLDIAISVGKALATIRDKKLYKEPYGTFEQYCEQRWGFTRQRGYQLIAAHKMSTIVDIDNESWARALAELKDPLEKKTAIMLAYDAAPATNKDGRVTAALLEEAVATIQEMKLLNGRVSIDDKMPAATASVIAKHHARVQEHIQGTNEQRGLNEGTVVLILKHEKCKVVATAPKRRRVTFEFENEQVYQKLLAMLKGKNASGLEMKITKHYPKSKLKT
jgi:hypothetical protein